jgi:hypothetical protein
MTPPEVKRGQTFSDNCPDPFGRRAQGRIIEMCIARRCSWTRMTEQPAYDFKARAGLDREGCKRMS